jgi:hypothetical protein
MITEERENIASFLQHVQEKRHKVGKWKRDGPRREPGR